MKPPEAIYQAICRAPRVGTAIAALADADLARLIAWLKAGKVPSGIPGLILATAEEEAAERFTKMHS